MTTTVSRSSVWRLFASRLISLTGGAAAFVALNFSIYQRTRSTAWLAAALLVTFGVEGMAGPFAGALGDRFDRRLVMIGSDLASAAVFSAMVLVHSPALLLALAFLAALAESPFFSASAAAMPNLVSEDDLSWANGMVSVGQNAGIVLGPLVGGVLLASVGAGGVFAINAVSFVLSAALVASVRRPFSGNRGGGAEFRGLRSGFVHLWNDRVLRTVMFAWLVVVFGLGTTMVADVPLVGLFGAGSLGYGVLIAFWGGGSIVGSLLGGRLRRRTEPPAMVAGLGVVALTAVIVGVSPWFWLVLGSVLVMGVGDGVSLVANQGILQRRTPDAVRSRVLGAMEAFVHTGLAVSYLVGGPAVDALGPRVVYVLGGVLALAGAAVGIGVFRLLRAEPEPAEPEPVEPEPAQPPALEASDLFLP